MASLVPLPKFRALDSNGEPLVGGKLYSYEAETSTPLATYTDASGATPNANPVILDANGEANVWIGSASYKLILKDSSDVVQWTVDQVSAFGEAPSALYRWGGTATGTADALALSPTTALTSYQAGLRIAFIAASTNTGPATLNVSALGAKSIKSLAGNALNAGEIIAGRVYTVTYNGTDFLLGESVPDWAAYRDVVYLTSADSPYTVAQSHNGKVFVISSAGGAITINLPQISGINLPFSALFVLQTAGNNVTINRGGATDTVGGASSKTLSYARQWAHLVADTGASPDDWAYSDNGPLDDLILTGTGKVRLPNGTTAQRPSSPSNGDLRYNTTTNEVEMYRNGAWYEINGRVNSYVRAWTGNGHGSTNTKVRRFTNSETQGTDITYTDSAANGASFTINKAGLYEISYTDAASVGASHGISLNSASLTTNVSSLSKANGKIKMTSSVAGAASYVAQSLRLAVNDVIRPHTDGTNNDTTDNIDFRITRVSD